MKKLLWSFVCCLYAFSANAQMGDLLGTLAVDGTTDAAAMEGINKMNNAMNLVKFKQDLARVHSEIQVMFIGNYGEAKKSLLYFRGLKGLEWDVLPVSINSYCLDIKGLNKAQCEIAKSPEWGMAEIKVNEIKNGECQPSANHVSMCF